MPIPQGSSAPMSAAPFVWRDDGRPDWRSMWTSFCDLALYGGPPHRGGEQALRGCRIAVAEAASDTEIVAEMRRGIWETTGLFAELQSPDWLAVTCESRAMAEWLGAAIAPENVEPRVEDDRVLLPAGPRFRLEDEVKSIVTVVAKTHHYWTIHARTGARPRPDEGTNRYGFRCVACGLDVRVSRPVTAADLDATCPIDGTRMARWGLVTTPGSASFWHAHGPGEPYHSHETYRPEGQDPAADGLSRPLKLGVGGSGDGKTVLIDALRRRYGRRRAVVASLAGASEVKDPAVDLVLVELGDDSEASASGPPMVDAAIGVLDATAAAQALRRGDRSLNAWQLLVVSTAGDATVDLSWLEGDMGRPRARPPVVLVDLATVEGIDVIVTWLQRALLLEPWRERRDRVRPPVP